MTEKEKQSMTRVAAGQMCSIEDVGYNLDVIKRLIRQAKDGKVDIIGFPENCLYMGSIEKYTNETHSNVQSAISEIASICERLQISVLLGSVFEKADKKKFYNTSTFIGSNGQQIAQYRKIHLFDAVLPDLTYNESHRILAGTEISFFQHRGLIIGLTICYDVRFPSLYQQLSGNGAQVIFVPAAFTVPTGKDHWIPLLKARAIENQCYICAPAQFGKHNVKRESYGRSALIDPWGTELQIAANGEGIIWSDIDIVKLNEIRTRMPVVSHRVRSIDF